jgi:hypothetical protein
MMPTAPEPRIGFLVGGVQKGGTSALARYLSAHPRLRLPTDKEAHVFDATDFDDAWTPVRVDQRYANQFEDAAAGGLLLGDATPFYLVHPRVVARIARYNPGMRWIVLLRDPVERALSHFHMERQRGNEHWPLWPALLLERWRLRGHQHDLRRSSPFRRHGYRLRGDYARQLDVLYAHFPREQVLLLRSERLREQPAACVAEACAFLGVEPPVANASYPPVFVGDYPPPSRWTRGLLRWLLRRERRALRDRYGIAFDG